MVRPRVDGQKAGARPAPMLHTYPRLGSHALLNAARTHAITNGSAALRLCGSAAPRLCALRHAPCVLRTAVEEFTARLAQDTLPGSRSRCALGRSTSRRGEIGAMNLPTESTGGAMSEGRSSVRI